MKRITALIFILLALLVTLAACSEEPVIKTSLGDFTLTKVEFVQQYDVAQASEGADFLLVRLTPVVDSQGLIDKMQPYFYASDKGGAPAKVTLVGAADVGIYSIAYEQPSGGAITYALVFEVPSSWRDQKGIRLVLPAPDNTVYEIK